MHTNSLSPEVQLDVATGEHVLTSDDRAREFRLSTKLKIYRQSRRGVSVEELARQFSQTRTTIHRIINMMRRVHIMELPLDYIGNEQFSSVLSRQTEAAILAPLQATELPTTRPPLPKDLPAYLASLYDVPLLTREQEAHLFRKLNYLKYKASTLRERSASSQPEHAWMNRIEKLYDASVATKNQLIRANLRLVVSIAKRHTGTAGDIFELVSDGNVSLIRAVEKFDFSLGNRFSTYASWAIMKNFTRTIPAAFRHRDKFSTGCPELFGTVEDLRPEHCEQELAQSQRETCVARLLDRLDERERQIITSRFGLTPGQEPLRLRQVGIVMNVSKERVRQIQCRAMNKLREAAEQDHVEDLL